MQAMEPNNLELFPLGPPVVDLPPPDVENEMHLPRFDLNYVPPAITINLELNHNVEIMPAQDELSPIIQPADPLANVAGMVSPGSGYSSPVDEEIDIIEQPDLLTAITK